MSFSGRTETLMTDTITNDGFFPALVVGDFQSLHRVPSHYADDSILHHLDMARVHINAALESRKEAWMQAGFETLEATALALDPSLPMFYRSAVYNRAKAYLLADFQTFSRRDIAADQAREGYEIQQSLLAESHRSLRKLLGHVTRSISVELL